MRCGVIVIFMGVALKTVFVVIQNNENRTWKEDIKVAPRVSSTVQQDLHMKCDL